MSGRPAGLAHAGGNRRTSPPKQPTKQNLRRRIPHRDFSHDRLRLMLLGTPQASRHFRWNSENCKPCKVFLESGAAQTSELA